jgi:8-oxo-dGTP pyrophosphatase MutT (NUDIX family)
VILATLVYCIRGDDHVDEVLLMQRRKEPNTGLWTAPGGKLEPGESPFTCARREIREEAGIVAEEMRLRGILTLTAPRPDWDWLLFAYVVTRFETVASADEREGVLRWWAQEDIPALEMPQADRVFLAPVLDLARPVHEATFRYDADLTLAEVIVHAG